MKYCHTCLYSYKTSHVVCPVCWKLHPQSLYLPGAEPLLEAQEDYSNDALYGMLSAYVAEKGYKNGYVMWPIRTAASGKQMTPCGATEILEILGKEESIARIQKAIEKLS